MVLTTESYEAEVCMKDNNRNGLRKAMQLGMHLSEYSLGFGRQNYNVQIGNEKLKTCFTSHLVLLDAETAEIKINELFAIPKSVKINRLTNPAHRLFINTFSTGSEIQKGALAKHTSPEFMELLTMNRATDNKAMDAVDEMAQQFMLFEPTIAIPGDRGWGEIRNTNKTTPCSCTAETIWYSGKSILLLVWDTEELASLGLPPDNNLNVIITVKNLLAVRWINANILEFYGDTEPTAASWLNIYYGQDIDLFKLFCMILEPEGNVKINWRRQMLHPKFRAYMVHTIYIVARQHQFRYRERYNERQFNVTAAFNQKDIKMHRYPITGGLRPNDQTLREKEDVQEQMFGDFVMHNLHKVIHEVCCATREGTKPLPHYQARLNEQMQWLNELNTNEESEEESEEEDAMDEQDQTANSNEENGEEDSSMEGMEVTKEADDTLTPDLKDVQPTNDVTSTAMDISPADTTDIAPTDTADITPADVTNSTSADTADSTPTNATGSTTVEATIKIS
jgi:hypothetical protein